jgi:hypothetical protein
MCCQHSVNHTEASYSMFMYGQACVGHTQSVGSACTVPLSAVVQLYSAHAS